MDQPWRKRTDEAFATGEILLRHPFVERARVGTPPLRWDDALAVEASVWARELADTGRWLSARLGRETGSKTGRALAAT